MTPADAIAYSLNASQKMMDMMVADLSGSDWLHRPTPKANCAAWTIGHLVVSDRRVLGMLGVTDLPAVPEGFDKRFSRDVDAPGATDFGDTSILVPMFDQYRTMLVEKVKSLTAADLEKPMEKPNPRFKNIGEFVAFMALHVAMHAGQISTIRRSLGRPAIV